MLATSQRAARAAWTVSAFAARNAPGRAAPARMSATSNQAAPRSRKRTRARSGLVCIGSNMLRRPFTIHSHRNSPRSSLIWGLHRSAQTHLPGMTGKLLVHSLSRHQVAAGAAIGRVPAASQCCRRPVTSGASALDRGGRHPRRLCWARPRRSYRLEVEYDARQQWQMRLGPPARHAREAGGSRPAGSPRAWELGHGASAISLHARCLDQIDGMARMTVRTAS